MLLAFLTMLFCTTTVRATIYLSYPEGWSQPVGDWDEATKTGTLTQNVNETIEIISNGITLDGGGHTVAGSGSIEWGINGINANGRNHLTFKNLNVSNFAFGISLWSSSNCIVTGNNFSNNGWGGIWLVYSSYNTLTANTCNSNINNYYSWGDGITLAETSSGNIISNNVCNSNGVGISLFDSHYNTLSGNNASDNFWAIWFYSGYRIPGEILGCNYNTLTSNICNSTYGGIGFSYAKNNILSGNTCSSGIAGIYLIDCSNNTLSDNTCNSNTSYGIQLVSGYLYLDNNNNTLTGNTVSNNYWGIYLDRSIGDRIYNNNFINNSTQAFVSGGSGNIFNLPEPTGGNFWSNWTWPDTDPVDGFVDTPYVFDGGHDDLPLRCWDSDGIPIAIEDAVPNNGDGNNDGTPDSEQSDVASLPNSADGQYVTIVSPDGTKLEGVSAIANPSPADAPASVKFPVGFFEFKVSGITIGGSTNVTLLLPLGHKLKTYYKYGPTPDNPTEHWYEFLYDGTTGAEIVSNRTIVLHFVDGQRGDSDLTANGRIVDPGGPSESLNTAPSVTIIEPTSGFVASVGTPVDFTGMIDDPDVGDTHTAIWTIGSEDHTGTVLEPLVADSLQFSQAGIYQVSLTVTDSSAVSDTATTVGGMPAFIVIYDPQGGFVTGGGWILSPAGAYRPNPSLAGKANFGFVSKYQKGATVPTGNTEFIFKAGDLNFHSTSYDWLVVTGSNYARFKGAGTINRSGEYKFMLWAGDNAPDTFRIKIWQENELGEEFVVYDNGFDQEIMGGSIIVHTK